VCASAVVMLVTPCSKVWNKFSQASAIPTQKEQCIHINTVPHRKQYAGATQHLTVQCVRTHNRAEIPPHNDTRYKEQQQHQQRIPPHTYKYYYNPDQWSIYTLATTLLGKCLYCFFTEKNHTSDDLTFTSLVKKKKPSGHKQMAVQAPCHWTKKHTTSSLH
jgi:hypothetical protein